MQVAGADYPERPKRFDVVYELFSSRTSERARVKTQVADGESLPTVIHVWKGADWFEREIYDMFGIKFDGHPNMRRLLVHQQFVGWPPAQRLPRGRQSALHRSFADSLRQ